MEYAAYGASQAARGQYHPNGTQWQPAPVAYPASMMTPHPMPPQRMTGAPRAAMPAYPGVGMPLLPHGPQPVPTPGSQEREGMVPKSAMQPAPLLPSSGQASSGAPPSPYAPAAQGAQSLPGDSSPMASELQQMFQHLARQQAPASSPGEE